MHIKFLIVIFKLYIKYIIIIKRPILWNRKDNTPITITCICFFSSINLIEHNMIPTDIPCAIALNPNGNIYKE